MSGASAQTLMAALVSTNESYTYARFNPVTPCFSMTYSTATFPLDLYAVVRSSYPRSFKTVRTLCGVVGMFMLVWFAVTRLFPAYKPDHIRVTRHLCFHLPFQVVRMKANFRHVILLATSEKQTPQLGVRGGFCDLVVTPQFPSGCRCCNDEWPARLSLEEFGRGSNWYELTGAFTFDNIAIDSGR